MANLGLTVNQASTILSLVNAQATGVAAITPTDVDSFTSLAQTTLRTGYDKTMGSISQVLSDTVFSIRSFTGQFKGLWVDARRWGNHVRKENPLELDLEDNEAWDLIDGQSIDPWTVKKPQVLETNFYGFNTWQQHVTKFRNQLDQALSSPEEFARFIEMVFTSITNQLTQTRENAARALVCNLIGAKYQADSTNVIYLLDEYMNETGLTGLTPTTIRQPANWEPFAKWLVGYLQLVSSKLRDRTVKYHMNFTVGGVPKYIMRHTPYENQKAYFNAKIVEDINTQVMSGAYQPEYLKLVDHELVNYWQSPDSPLEINVTPSYNNADGTQVTSPTATNLDNVFGVIFDEEAIGITLVDEHVDQSPYNPAGEYTNTYWKANIRYWIDLTENAVVFLLDTTTP